MNVSGSVRRLAVSAYLLSTLVAVLAMLQASQLLGLVQSEGQSAYTMDALTRAPVPLNDDRVAGALEAWRTASLSDPTDPSSADANLLELMRSSITWHVLLDFVFLAPTVALILAWLVRASFPTARKRFVFALPIIYLLVDWAETALTGLIADNYMDADSRGLHGTAILVGLTAAKWLVLIITLVTVALGALVRSDRFTTTKQVARLLWAVRVQVIAVVMFSVLVAFPVGGPLDQIPDLLRSAYDESWTSSSVWVPLVLLLGFSALVWCTGMLIVRAASGGQVETTDAASMQEITQSFDDYWNTRKAWVFLTLGLGALGAATFLFSDTLHPSPAVFAAFAVTLVLLLLDLLLAFLVGNGVVTQLARKAPLLTPDDARPLTWLVTGLAAAPLCAAGLGVVRAYAPLVLLQSGDPDRTAYPGATAWFWGGAISAVLAPILFVWLVRRRALVDFDSAVASQVAGGADSATLVEESATGQAAEQGQGDEEPATTAESWEPAAGVRWTLVRNVSLGVVIVFSVFGIALAVSPVKVAPAMEAHGLLVVGLGLAVGCLGLLQWRSETDDPVALARVLGLNRTPWILLIVVVALVAGSMDTKVGYHAVTLEDAAALPEQTSLRSAFKLWHKEALACRPDTDELPLLLVAAPGGGARAAYWTGQVMAGLGTADSCEGDSVFAASGVSGGSLGLAVWSSTDNATATRDGLDALVDTDALSATVAGMLFRDLPRAFTGVHPEGVDRAAVEQDSWTDSLDNLNEPFFKATADAWSPKLLLNASDISTGCKVILSQLTIHSEQHPPASQACKDHPAPEASAGTSLQAGAVDAAQFLNPTACPTSASTSTPSDALTSEGDSTGGDSAEQHNVTMATAALLSARFPYVSPSGALTACTTSEPERLYIADGGYLDNTGLHTLLALWQDLEPLVTAANTGDGPKIVPVAVLVENHYRAQSALQPGGRVRELTGPPNADRTALLRAEALEQSMAAEFDQPVAGVDSTSLQRWYVIAPSTTPDVSAPLGWSLSEASRNELDCQMPPDIRPAATENCPKRDAGTDIGALVDMLDD